jgi:hypothetical protein
MTMCVCVNVCMYVHICNIHKISYTYIHMYYVCVYTHTHILYLENVDNAYPHFVHSSGSITWLEAHLWGHLFEFRASRQALSLLEPLCQPTCGILRLLEGAKGGAQQNSACLAWVRLWVWFLAWKNKIKQTQTPEQRPVVSWKNFSAFCILVGCLIVLNNSLNLFYCFFFPGLGLELRVSHLLGRPFRTWATPPAQAIESNDNYSPQEGESSKQVH